MAEISINVKNTTMVKPSQETPKRRMWVSNLDHVVIRMYCPSIYFYRPNSLPGFFDPNLVKEALRRVLIPYCNVAGRLRRDVEGRRIEIDCNDEGVLFVEAETTSVLDDLGDFSPTMEFMKLIPSGDCSGEISSFPLLFLQLTRFKCGGVSLGVAMHHLLADGFSRVSFINSWANMARGLELATLPSIDRTLIQARDPPSPKFHHIEYQPSPPPLTPHPTITSTSKRAFTISRGQINALKTNCKEAGDMTQNYTSFEILSGHIWRCVCKARGLSDAQEVKLYIPVDARSRLKPNLPQTYFGNGIFMASVMATAGDLVSNSVGYAANKIHESLIRMGDEYLRSALDYIELRLDNDVLVRGPHTVKSPNLSISSLANLPVYGADFGWGKPAFTGPGITKREGACHLMPTATNDGTLSVVISLQHKHMQLFETYFSVPPLRPQRLHPSPPRVVIAGRHCQSIFPLSSSCRHRQGQLLSSFFSFVRPNLKFIKL